MTLSIRPAKPKMPLPVLLVGFGFSLAANLLWTWPGGYVRVLGGVFASVALPMAVHMWPYVIADHWMFRLLRDGVMFAIAALAAVTTFVHASSLLIAHGEQVWLARAYPVMTELLVVFAILANRASPTPSGSTAEAWTVDELAEYPEQAEAEPVPPPPSAKPRARAPRRPSTTAAISCPRDERIDWLRAQDGLSTWSEKVEALQTKFGVSSATAKRDVRAISNEVTV